MNEQNWKREEYSTWDEAFRGLVPEARRQSVRVADYTQVLFVQACASLTENRSEAWNERMQAQYAELAYKCGLYHQLGKSMLIPKYQLWDRGFTEEEKAIYRTYPAEGRRLVALLQENRGKVKDKKGAEEELPTKNISWLMIRESCEQHMERYDGSGFPNGRVGDEISPIAQVVGLAKELDRLVSETKSENPFDEAYADLIAQAGKEFSEEWIEVLKTSRGKCRGVYRKYIRYTKTLPKTIPLVDKRKERPMGLTFRRIGEDMFEAVPWFAGVLKEPEKRESLAELEPLMLRTKILDDVMLYLLYEAADAVLHLQNCQLKNEGVVIAMPAGFFKGESRKVRLDQMIADQKIELSKLLLTVPVEFAATADKVEKEALTEYIESGLQLVLDNYRQDALSPQQVREIGFAKVRIAPDVEPDTKAYLTYLFAEQGIVCVEYSDSAAEYTEDALVQLLLANERMS